MLRPAPSAFMWDDKPEHRGPTKRLSAGQLLGMDDYCRKQRVMTPEDRELQRRLDAQKTNDTASQTADSEQLSGARVHCDKGVQK